MPGQVLTLIHASIAMPRFQVQDGVAVVTLNNPPVNSLNHALRSHILSALDAAEADQDVRAIVLTGGQRAFCAGADVGEMGQPQQLAEPVLPTLLARVEACSKPVVAALSGVALGGGLELAMSCHARVALDNAMVGLPEITLGLIPGAGGTQRLPRLVGVAAALALMQSGQAQPARQLAESGLFTRVLQSDHIPAACAIARELADRGEPLPRARDREVDPVEVAAAVEASRNQLGSRQRLQLAHGLLLDAVAAVALPFDEGLKREREIFLALVPSIQAQALRYLFKAEREARKLPPGVIGELQPVHCVAVIGAGTMGTGIAICALDVGLDVLLLEQDEQALERGRQRVSQHYAGRVATGKVKATVADACQARLQPTLDWSSLARADVVIEAVFEDLAVKQEVFRKLDMHARRGAVIATNTSYLDVDAIAAVTTRPADVLGLHFFSPANVMRLLEVVRGRHSSDNVLATGLALGRALGKLPVLCGNAFGFIGNRIYDAYRRQCEFMLEDGAWPEDVDGALLGMGFAMGPFAVADLSGLDIAWRMRKAQAALRDPRERYVAILDRLCEQGRLGRKTGAGYYVYSEGKPAAGSDATVRAVIEQARVERGIQPRKLDADEIRQRVLMAMANEAACLVADGVAARASDIDMVMVQGYGFPRWEGGPVFWARQQTRQALNEGLEDLAHAAGPTFVRGDFDRLFE